jgi:predicted transcriptional regulator of viral defense system
MAYGVIHNAHMRTSSSAPDLDALYAIAEPKEGYFTASAAEAAGYSRSLLAHHVKAGMLERVAHGIYRLRRYPESPRADLVVAELRAGPHAVISHESALEVYGLSDVLSSEVHVTVPRTASRRRSGVRLHTSRMEAQDVTSRDGVTVTTVERTIAFLRNSCSRLSTRQLSSASRRPLS